MLGIEQIENAIVDDFGLFDQWNEKYHYIIELGEKLPPLDVKYKKEENKIKGCQSSVWLHSYEKDGRIFFEADSDSQFVKGVVAILIRVLSGQRPQEIIDAQLKFIDQIGLRQHMMMTRQNGLPNMIKQMKLYALGFQNKVA